MREKVGTTTAQNSRTAACHRHVSQGDKGVDFRPQRQRRSAHAGFFLFLLSFLLALSRHCVFTVIKSVVDCSAVCLLCFPLVSVGCCGLYVQGSAHVTPCTSIVVRSLCTHVCI